MVSQLLFGEMVEVLEEKGSWQYVRLADDDYEGWIDRKQLTDLTEDEFRHFSNKTVAYSTDLITRLKRSTGDSIHIVKGSSLYFSGAGKMNVSGIEYIPESPDSVLPASSFTDWISHAMMYMHAPYLWGGRTPFGIDCSGFTQVIMKCCGIRIKRDASQQAEQGATVNLADEALPGDLAFFDNAEGRIVHVGLILPEGKIIHSSGKVRIDLLDHQGIFMTEEKRYSHNLRLIKRFN